MIELFTLFTFCGFSGVFLFFVAAVVGIIFLVIHSKKKEQQRNNALAAWCARHQFSLNPSRDHAFDEMFPEFACLRGGSNRYAYNIINGRWDGRDLIAFDYHYETHSTDSKGRSQTHHHHFSAVMLRTDLTLKPLVIRAENLFDKIAGVFGFDDIDFESAEFSRRFCVKSPDRRWAYDVLHPRAIQFLLDSPKFSIELDGRYVMAWRGGRFSVADREAALRVIDGLLDQLPAYVREGREG